MAHVKFVARVLIAACFAQAAWAAAAEGKAETALVRVVYVDPEKFTDVGDRYYPSDETRNAYLTDLKKYIVRRAKPLLKPDERLVIAISNIDMAGSFEPGRYTQTYGRIIRDVYPPRIDLSFTITGPGGVVVKSGERKLRDLTFLAPTVHPRTDPLRYEKKLLDDWLRQELGGG